LPLFNSVFILNEKTLRPACSSCGAQFQLIKNKILLI
jgi:hypothetical protein